MWYKIKRLWYIFTSPDKGEMLIWHSINGKFRVKYPDGQYSQNFGYWTAKNYAEMFGGTVEDNF